jgi:transposase
MASPRTLTLTPEQRAQLERMRDQHPKAYLRERAAALLKIAQGYSIRRVALHGLLRPREPETVGDWLDRYLAEGVAGLRVRPGRGRKPAFFSPRA